MPRKKRFCDVLPSSVLTNDPPGVSATADSSNANPPAMLPLNIQLCDDSAVPSSTSPNVNCLNKTHLPRVDGRGSKQTSSTTNRLCFNTDSASDAHRENKKRKKGQILTNVGLAHTARTNNLSSAVITYGQAAYQRKRRVPGFQSTYSDVGDMIQMCENCNALFWLKESKRVLKNQRPVYTECCLKGRIHLNLCFLLHLIWNTFWIQQMAI